MRRALVALFGVGCGLLLVEGAARVRALREYAREAGTPLRGLVAHPDGEAYFRYDPELGWSPRPGARSPTGEVTISPQGFRGEEVVPAAKAPGERRVVCIGDSYTFGAERRDDEAFPAAMAARLGLSARVVNLGVNGYGLDQAVLRFERDGLPLRPDAVVLTLIPDDLHRASMSMWANGYAKPRFWLEGGRLVLFNVPTPPRAAPGQALGAVPLSRREALRVLLGLHPLSPAMLVAAGRDILQGDQLDPLNAALLERLREDCARAKARLVVLLVPAAQDLPDGPPARAQLAAWCRARGVPYGDLFPEFARGGDALQRFGEHPTAAGYRAIARRALELLGWGR